MNIKNRLETFRSFMSEKQIELSLIWEPDNQYYLSGFRAITYSRPIVTLISPEQTELIVPGLEEVHAAEKANVDKLYVYYEQIDRRYREVSYLDHLSKIVKKYPSGTRLGVETGVLPSSVYLYLKEFGFKLVDIGEKVVNMRAIKDEFEIERLKIAGKLSDYAIEESLKHVRAGISELEFDSYGDRLLLELASKDYAEELIGYENWTCSGIRRSEMPHLYSSTRKFADGDVVIHSRQVWFNGYRAENERTFFVGQPSEKQKDLLKVAIEAQRVAMDLIRPGITASEVDLASYEVFKKAGYGEYVNHRVGHGLGLSEHEEPYLRFDNELVLQEGMVYTIEPGVYVPGLGGYRHSDTVILTKNGSYSITQYPRDIDSLMF
ncbi:aminopeptidase P family protein [Bacillus sp. EB106-08-02-XG196]|uniref:M24 family metallopeptidase n=1 Tax=Bacillus sp. EB106-08-02-XG196 TaxID=2737049 RepID=UPI0015C4C923|nr:Xaa-Pro peptidase family protein [Bacillus sp. EB106-08-02-XG196]NWQ39553.1 aminopeptidase P family protein [Bacillus sp. EB106-08-02-XG196]